MTSNPESKNHPKNKAPAGTMSPPTAVTVVATPTLKTVLVPLSDIEDIVDDACEATSASSDIEESDMSPSDIPLVLPFEHEARSIEEDEELARLVAE